MHEAPEAGAGVRQLAVAVNGLLASVCGFLFARSLATIGEGLDGGCDPQCVYVRPQYFFTYDHGFIRRGLPGTLFKALGGRSSSSAEALRWWLSLAAVLSVAVLAVIVFRQLRGSALRYAAAALVFLCPLSASLYVADPGRYDIFGVLALLALAVLGLRTRPGRPGVVAGAVAGAMVIAALCEEFLVLFLVAPALVLVLRHGEQLTRGRRVAAAGVPLLLAFAVAAASTVAPPTQAQVDAAQVASGNLPDTWSAALFMRSTLRSELHFVAQHGFEPVLHTILVWLSVFTLAVLVLGVAVHIRGRWYWNAAAANAVAAIALSIVGTDQRRWWTLAFLSQVTVLAVGRSGRRAERTEAPAGTSLVLVVGGAILAFVLLPQMFLVAPHRRGDFLAIALLGTAVAAFQAVAFVRGWWGSGSPGYARASPEHVLFLSAPLVLALGTLFVTTDWILVPLDFWRHGSTWSDIASYWFSWL